MSAGVITGALVGIAIGFAAGALVGLQRTRERLRRLEAGAVELAGGNFAHRVILPGHDQAAATAEAINGLAESIQRERESAMARDAVQRRLIADVSHDLRTPITSIAGYVDALQRGLGDEPERYLAVIASKAEDLSQLTDDLFYAARIEAGELELKCERLDLAEAVRRAVLGFERQLVETGARVDVGLPATVCAVRGDASALGRILSNLLANSLRHAEGMAAFVVEMSQRDGRYLVRLSNDGPPLPEDADRLFERGVTGTASGAGLGLSIARELAELMGAAVWAENGAEGGAAFTLAFPAEPEFTES